MVLAHGGKAHDLAQIAFSLAVDRAERLPHDGAEDVALALLEVLVVLGVLAVLGILLAGALRANVGGIEGARHSDIQRESSVLFPQRDGHIAWSSARGQIPRFPSLRAARPWQLTPPSCARRCGGR